MSNLYSEIIEAFKERSCLFFKAITLNKIGLGILLLIPFILLLVTITYIFNFHNIQNLVQKPRFFSDIYVISNEYLNIDNTFVNLYIMFQIIFWGTWLIVYFIIYLAKSENVNRNAIIHIYLKSRMIIYCLIILLFCFLLTYIDNSNEEYNLALLKSKFNEFINNSIDKDYLNQNIDKDINELNEIVITEQSDVEQLNKQVLTLLIIKQLKKNEYNFHQKRDNIPWIQTINYSTNTMFETTFIENHTMNSDVTDKIQKLKKEIDEKIMKIRNKVSVTTSKQFIALVIQMIVFVAIGIDLFHKKK